MCHQVVQWGQKSEDSGSPTVHGGVCGYWCTVVYCNIVSALPQGHNRGGEMSVCFRSYSPRTMDAFAPSGLIRGRRAAFISVRAYCQVDAPMAKAWASEGAGIMVVSYRHSSSESYFPSGAVLQGGQSTQISGSVRKRRSVADVSATGNSACPSGTQSALPFPAACRTWRLNSSLRSHRTSETQLDLSAIIENRSFADCSSVGDAAAWSDVRHMKFLRRFSFSPYATNR